MLPIVLFIGVIFTVSHLFSPVALAQPTSGDNYELLVTLHDHRGQPVPSMQMEAWDAAGTQRLAQAQTDATGAAQLSQLPATVRLRVQGQPRNGLPLIQPGRDAQGIWLHLDPAASITVVNLRVDRDGLVLPDPQTMIALDPSGPTVDPAPASAWPLLSIATPVPIATPAPILLSESAPARPVASANPAPNGLWWIALFGISLSLLLGIEWWRSRRFQGNG